MSLLRQGFERPGENGRARLIYLRGRRRLPAAGLRQLEEVAIRDGVLGNPFISVRLLDYIRVPLCLVRYHGGNLPFGRCGDRGCLLRNRHRADFLPDRLACVSLYHLAYFLLALAAWSSLACAICKRNGCKISTRRFIP